MPIRRKKSLLDGYRFPGFYPKEKLKGKLGDPQARIIVYTRRSKKRSAGPAAMYSMAGTTSTCVITAIFQAAIAVFTLNFPFGAYTAVGVMP